jgi:Uma2 family endonuclease
VSTVQTSTEQRFVLRATDWPCYRAVADAIGERHVRLTYDRGNIEFMTLSHGHERFSNLLGQFIEVLTDELDMPRQSGGSMTLGREVLDRALEPDQCYYIDNEPLVRDKDEIDLETDPPPDLAIDVEISRSSRDRMGIYAAIGVREVWRFDGESLRVYVLRGRRYVAVRRSRYFPRLPLAAVTDFLNRRTEMDETTLVRSFRRWVRDQIARGWRAST